MAAVENPIAPPTQEPHPDPIKLDDDDSKPGPAQEKADPLGSPPQETACTPESEGVIVLHEDNGDAASDEATRDSNWRGSSKEHMESSRKTRARRASSESVERSEDPVHRGARRAVISAIGKIERFQEAIQFNLVGELSALSAAVGNLPPRQPADLRPPSPFQRGRSPRYEPAGMPSPPPSGTTRGPPMYPGVTHNRRPRSPEVPVITVPRGSRSNSSNTDTDDEDGKEEIPLPCLVQRLSMEDWRRRARSESPPVYLRPRPGIRQPRPPRPPHTRSSRQYHHTHKKSKGSPSRGDESEPDYVIKAYYRNVPTKIAAADNISTEEDFKRAYAQGRNREKPSRVEITSEIIVDELQELTGLTLQDDPFIMIPPYKLLVYKWPKINARLTTLKEELGALDLELAKASSTKEDAKESIEKLGTTVRSAEDVDAVEVEESKTKQKDKEKKEFNEKVKAKGALAERASHMQCLCDFIKTDLAHLLGLRLKVQEASIDKIAFEDLYYLFTPGDFVIAAGSKNHQLYQAYSVSGGRMRIDKNRHIVRGGSPAGSDSDAYVAGSGIGTWTSLTVDTYLLAWDGERLSTLQVTRRIKHFIGEKRVTDLEIYPVRFCKDAELLREHMRQRGQKLINCFGHKKYYGSTVERLEDTSRRRRPSYRYASPPRRPDRSVLEEIESDVYVDTKSYYQRSDNEDLGSKLRRSLASVRETTESFGRFDRAILGGDHDLDEALTEEFMSTHRYLLYPSKPEEMEHVPEFTELVPYQLPAYEFRSRRWVWLDIEKVEEIDKSEEARRSGWKELVIPEKYSQLLVSLVDNHTSGFSGKKDQNLAPSVQIDLVRGKGRGLIILLHGPPGSGKTSTAETIAAYTKRPLYSITCGDIGVTPDEVEDRLQEHTELAEKWGCVLLLDEADVFLMRRSWDDMERNALVSVFLRHLEYYSGILFLTTNIVGVIDEAFKSRIHVALRYPSIDLDSTKKIWNNVLDHIERDNETAQVKVEFNRVTLLEFASAHYRKHEQTDSTWNGRQVRNAFQIAIALGQYERLTRIKDEGLELDQALRSKNKSLTTVRLTKRNFLNIASTARDFEDYITSIRGSDSSMAKASMHRDDDYGRGYQKAQKAYPARGEQPPQQERQPPQARGAARDAYATPTSRQARREEVRTSGGKRRVEEELDDGLMDDEDEDEFESKDTKGYDELDDE